MQVPWFRTAAVAAALLTSVPGLAATIRPIGFGELVAKAGWVVEGTVIDVQVHSVGAPTAPAAPKPHVAPVSPAGGETAVAAAGTPERHGLAVEGGMRLETEVTLAVDRAVVGTPSSSITFRVAGGSDGVRRMTVFGMPTFEMGRRYLVFLHPDYTRTAAPLVGVHQGFFQVVDDPMSGAPMLLDADDNVVVGIEGDRVAVRRNPATAGTRTPRLGPAPRPGPGAALGTDPQGTGAQEIRARITPPVERYWTSAEPPLSVDAFVAAVLAAREGRP